MTRSANYWILLVNCFKPRRLPWLGLVMAICFANVCASAGGTNHFPTASEILKGGVFANDRERDIFFLREIERHYPDYWPDLIEANITVNDYVLSPAKLLRFVKELGSAMRGRNDATACANLSRITGDAAFYANTNAYRPEILQAAAGALIQIGTNGWRALALSFNEARYREDSASLEPVAQVIGNERPASPELAHALEAAAFDFSTTNGATFPRCTTVAATNLLCLSAGPSIVRKHLRSDYVLHDPARYQAIVDGIEAAGVIELAPDLTAVQSQIFDKLAKLTNSPGPYRDDLEELKLRIERTLNLFKKKKLQ